MARTHLETKHHYESAEELLAESDIFSILAEQKARLGTQNAVFADFDRTLSDVTDLDSSQAVIELANQLSIPLIAITGNSYEQLMTKIEQREHQPYPILATSVGTEVYFRQTQNDGSYAYIKDIAWETGRVRTGFDRQAIHQRLSQVFSQINQLMPLAQAGFSYPNAPEDIKQWLLNRHEPFKVSGYFSPTTGYSAEEIVAYIKRNFVGQRVMWCENIDYVEGPESRAPHNYCIDILPSAKDDAVNYLYDLLKVEGGVVAGDSGNDIEMLLNSPPTLLMSLVGQARPEARRAIQAKVVSGIAVGPATFKDEVNQTRTVHLGGDETGPQSILQELHALESQAHIRFPRTSSTTG